MSFLRANLPSDDEEDDDYDPTKDKTAEKEDRLQPAAGQKAGKAQGAKRKRGAAIAGDDDGGAEGSSSSDDDDDGEGSDGDMLSPRAAAKRAKAADLFAKLNQKVGAVPSSSAVAAAAAAMAAPTSLAPLSRPAVNLSDLKAVSLSSLCRPDRAPKRKDADKFWMQHLGVNANGGAGALPGKPAPKERVAAAAGAAAAAAADAGTGAAGAGTSASAAALAAEALEAAKGATSAAAAARAGKVLVTETRRFAGKNIEVTTAVDADSKQAKKAEEKAKSKSGLDAVLESLAAAKKVTVLDKSRQDWSGLKEADAGLEEELEGHKKSGGTYLERQRFLQDAELREYERERDRRLAADIRTRGRT